MIKFSMFKNWEVHKIK